jgi:cyclin-dependent kinase 8/11
LIPESIIKSVLWQILNGVSYLHQNWIIHRDLKPANIMLTANGVVKIGDLGLARLFRDPLQSLYTGDKVVVTIWYRAPELLLGARHYTPSIDLWAVGCIFAELLALKPIFKGEETKVDNNNFNNGGGKKVLPFQKNQFQKVIDILGMPTIAVWPTMPNYPEYTSLSILKPGESNFDAWCHKAFKDYSTSTARDGAALLANLFAYDPARRETANDALLHPFFTASGGVRITLNAFEGQKYDYPARRILSDDVDIMAVSYSGSTANTKRSAVVSGDTAGRGRKRKLG